jgi:hypothetical protein
MFISKRKWDLLVAELSMTQTRIFSLEEELDKLRTNGMATIVNKLQKEVLTDKKESEDTPLFAYPPAATIAALLDIQPDEEPTLKGKVEAICEFLGLDFNITEKKVEKSKVVATKKKVNKKKGRR